MTTATSLLPSSVTGEDLLNAMREIDADPDGWIRKRNQKFVSKVVRKHKSLLENAPARDADASPEGYVKLFSKFMSRQHTKGPVNPENLPEHLRARDLAVLLGMSLDDIVEMARRGILKGYKRGKGWWFRRENIEQYIFGPQERE
jgi:excisionase family DNA binding protein